MNWWWAASQLSRNSAGFAPRTVHLWRGHGAPTEAEIRLIKSECELLTGALREWILTGKQKKISARFRMGSIYFAKVGERVKIGFSADIAGRLCDLRVATPDDLVLLGSMPGTEAMERHLHFRFRNLRIRGEWFRLDGRLLDFIADETNQKHRSTSLVRITP